MARTPELDPISSVSLSDLIVIYDASGDKTLSCTVSEFLDYIKSNSGVVSGSFAPVSDLTGLKAINTTNPVVWFNYGTINVGNRGMFYLDRTSELPADDINVVMPTTGVGRWISFNYSEGTLSYDSDKAYNNSGIVDETYTEYGLNFWKYINDTPTTEAGREASLGVGNGVPAANIFWELINKEEISGTLSGDIVGPIGNNEIRRFKGIRGTAIATTPNNYTVSFSYPVVAYTPNHFYLIEIGETNTGSCTLSFSPLSALSLKKNGNQDLVAGDLTEGQIIIVCYANGAMHIVGVVGSSSDFTASDFTYNSTTSYNNYSGDNTTYAIYNEQYWEYINSTPTTQAEREAVLGAGLGVPAENVYWTEVSKSDIDNIYGADFIKYNGKGYLQRFAGVTLRLDGTDNYTKTTSYTLPPLGTSSFYIVWPQNTNTGAVTINLNGQGAKNLYKNVNEPLVAGDFKANQRYIIGYDGTNFQLVGGTTNIIDGGAA